MWGKESSVLLLKMYAAPCMGKVQHLLSRSKRSKGVVKQLGSVYLALRNVINMTFSNRVTVEDIVWGGLIVFLNMTAQYLHLLTFIS